AFIDAYIAQCRHLCAVANGTETPRIDALEGSKSLEATLATAAAASDSKQIKL
ncbi:MAG TPA: oxidoreductase, partial [Alphaproteobacteria bacterium]|nr:oxidoreductase [Alphaproteobacteria bacterium]